MIQTNRLHLIPGTPDSVSAAIHDHARFGELLDATVPPSWPPDLLDRDALEWTLRAMAAPEFDPAWGMYWIVLRDPRVLIGACGFKGSPTSGGVELGYGIVSDQHRRGYATEATRAIAGHAFRSPQVASVFAETLPGHVSSIGVLDKCGFTLIGDGLEAGTIRYELPRGALRT